MQWANDLRLAGCFQFISRKRITGDTRGEVDPETTSMTDEIDPNTLKCVKRPHGNNRRGSGLAFLRRVAGIVHSRIGDGNDQMLIVEQIDRNIRGVRMLPLSIATLRMLAVVPARRFARCEEKRQRTGSRFYGELGGGNPVSSRVAECPW